MFTLYSNRMLIIFCAMFIFGTRSSAQQITLDQYIDTAFTRNQGLKQQQFDLEKSMYALKEAQAMFLPTSSFQDNYTKAGGGRTYNIPIGDLLNPIYTALNQLTASAKYPQLKNESFLINPDNFNDAKLHTTLPLINAEIRYNKLIKQQLITVQQASVNVYKRALVKDVKTAYFHYYQALQGIAIYDSELKLIHENIRENESLYRNGERNSTALLRSKTELERTNTQLIQALLNVKNSRSYFNFLLNRPLTDSILIDNNLALSLSAPDTSTGIGNREELKQLKTLQTVYVLDYKMQKAGFTPKLSTFIDLGSQGFGFAVNDKTQYYFWGVSLQWDVFTGGQRKFRAAQSRADADATTAEFRQTEQSLRMQFTQSYNDFESAKAACKSAESALAYASTYYNDQLKAYRAGQLIYLELIDAQQ